MNDESWIVRRGHINAWSYVFRDRPLAWTEDRDLAMRFATKLLAGAAAVQAAADGTEVAVFPLDEAVTPGIGRFVCSFTALEAIRFDGTRGSALAIAAAFPGRVALDVAHDDVLLVLSRDTLLGHEELRAVPHGAWLVARYGRRGSLDLLGDRLFRALHEPYPTSLA